MKRFRFVVGGFFVLLGAACTTVEEPPRVVQDTPGSPAVRPATRRDASPPAPAVRAFQSESTPGSGRTASDSRGTQEDTQRRALIRLELASALYQQGSHARALDEVRSALSIDPELAKAHGMLGLIYMDLRDAAQAESAFRRALALSPNDSELRNNYGWFLCQTGRPRESIAEFMTALKDPLYATPARPLHNAGVCALRLGDEATAQEYLQKAFQLDPANPVSMYHLAEIHLRRQQIDQAEFHAQRLLASYPPSAETLWLGIRVARKSGQREAMNSLSAQLRRQFPDSREAGLLQRGAFGD